jgi:phosphoglucomutase
MVCSRLMDLVAAGITPHTGEDPGEHYLELTEEFGAPFYTRIDGRQRPSRRRGCRSYHPIRADQEDFRLVAKAS